MTENSRNEKNLESLGFFLALNVKEIEKVNIRIKRNYASIVPDNKNIRIKSKRQER